MVTTVPTHCLNDGNRLPQLGLGLWQVASRSAASLVTAALAEGYRAFDTATMYGNEPGVGEALCRIASAETPIFVTTKLWNDDHGRERARRALAASLRRLGLPAVDLYLIHWPAPRRNAFIETWRAFIDLRAEGQVRSIGVSNFTTEHLERLIGETGVVPAVNQIELHPYFQQQALRAFHSRHGIVTQAWAPLGKGRLLDDPTLRRLADKHRRTVAQIALRWHIENGCAVIPKTERTDRLRENADIFGFRLDAEDMAEIARLDRRDGRLGPDPLTFS